MIKLLLVEDDEMNRDMLSRRLMWRGFQVVVAANGVEAIAQARSESPKIILMDLSLPIMSGWEATVYLKMNLNTAKIPIIGLTAHAMLEDQEKAMKAGCDDYDTKPVDLGRLLQKIASLVA